MGWGRRGRLGRSVEGVRRGAVVTCHVGNRINKIRLRANKVSLSGLGVRPMLEPLAAMQKSCVERIVVDKAQKEYLRKLPEMSFFLRD